MKRYTIRDISKMLNVSPETIRRWIRSGNLVGTAASKKGGFYVDEIELIKFVAKKPKYRMRLEQQGLPVNSVCDDMFKQELQATLREMIRERDRLNERILQLEKMLEGF